MQIVLLVSGFAGEKIEGINLKVGTDIVHQINLDDKVLDLNETVLIGSIKSRNDEYCPAMKRTFIKLKIERFKLQSGDSTNLNDLMKLYCYENKEG